MYNLQNGIQFETIPTPSDFKHRDYLSIYIAVHLAVYVFDCNVRWVPWEGVWMWSLLKFCISLCQLTKNARKYVYETDNNDLRLDFQNFFHIVFLLVFWKPLKYLNSRDMF